MGWIIGKGIGVPFRMGGGQSWSSYWSHQPEVLFFGLYSEISGGQMPNKVTGATDYLTVAGAAGSETYQCPNTAAYIAADTDYIWFKTDTTQRTTTTAELIGYDLQRTPVKYEDDAPNAIIAIIILKAGATLSATKRNYLFRDMWLPILWDNNLNAYGHIKSNRVGQQLWAPETIYLAVDTFTDTNGTLLNAHTMDVGSGWTAPNEFVISENKLTNNGSVENAAYRAVTETLKADVEITMSITIPDYGQYLGGILLRYQDNTHYWLCMVERDADGTPYVGLFENGSTQRGKVNIVQELITDTLKVIASGNALSVYWKDMVTPLITYSSATYNDKTKHGILAYCRLSSGYKFPVVDNFYIKEI
jgi:hypothetical protein